MSTKFSNKTAEEQRHKKAAAEKEHEPIRSGDTVVVSSAEAKAPAARAVVPEPDKPKPPSETKNERILRIIKLARERLRGRGSPELDVEVDELIAEVEGWGK